MGFLIFILVCLVLFALWGVWYGKEHPEAVKRMHEEQQRKQEQQQRKQNPLQIHCPTCGSTNVEKISGASKVGKAVAFGVLAAGSISKTFHCKNCGYRW